MKQTIPPHYAHVTRIQRPGSRPSGRARDIGDDSISIKEVRGPRHQPKHKKK